MTLLVCLDCTTAFAVGVRLCPHCGSERRAEQGTAAALGVHARGRVEEELMPKITVHGGPSDRHAIVALGPQPEPPAVEGGEDVSAGSSSETFTEKPSTTPETNVPGSPKPARKTGSRSRKARTVNSSASSMDGGQETAGSVTGSAADVGGGA